VKREEKQSRQTPSVCYAAKKAVTGEEAGPDEASLEWTGKELLRVKGRTRN